MTRPRVSVVVPVFNKARFLPAALDSIVAAVRSYGDAELIVVDHGSTDGSRELLASRYAADRADPRREGWHDRHRAESRCACGDEAPC